MVGVINAGPPDAACTFIDPSSCHSDYRFRASNLPRILLNLGIRDFHLINGCCINAQESLLIYINSLTQEDYMGNSKTSLA